LGYVARLPNRYEEGEADQFRPQATGPYATHGPVVGTPTPSVYFRAMDIGVIGFRSRALSC
jgi:hypothetical protein